MPLNQALIEEVIRESAATRKMLERVPDDKFDYKPHERSMSLNRLASHVAEIPLWTQFTIDLDVLDLGTGNFTPFAAKDTAELLARHDENIAKAIKALESADDETLMKVWTLKNGEHQIMAAPKIHILRGMTSNHLYHHRGQLSVYLRMLDVPVPGMYGPSNDEGGR